MSGDNSWTRQTFGLRSRVPVEDDHSLVELTELLLDDTFRSEPSAPARGRDADASNAPEATSETGRDQMDIDLLIQTFERRLARADDLAREERLAAREASEARRAIEVAQQAEDEAIAAMIAAAELRETEARAQAERESMEWARLREETEAREAAERIEVERQAAEAEALLAAAQAEAEAARLAAEREAEARAAAVRDAEMRERAAREALERAEEARARAQAEAEAREAAARERLAREQAERAQALRDAEARRAAALEAIEHERRAHEDAIAEGERRRAAIAARLHREETSAPAIATPAIAPLSADEARALASAPQAIPPLATRSTDKRYDDRFQAIFDQFEAQISEIGARPTRAPAPVDSIAPPTVEAPVEEFEAAASTTEYAQADGPAIAPVLETADPEPAPRPGSLRLRDAVASIAERQRSLDVPELREPHPEVALSRQMPLGPALEKLAETAAQIGMRQDPPPPALPATILSEIQSSIHSLSERFDHREAGHVEAEPAIRQAIEGLAERLDIWSQTGGRDADAAIERAVETIIGRIEETAIHPRQFENIERSLEDVMQQLRDGQHLAADAVETAANNAVRHALAALDDRPNPRLDAIEQRLADLVANAMGTERRTLDALDAVRASLQHVASRLPAASQEMAAPIAQSLGEVSANAIEVAERARAAARLAMEEAREEDERTDERAASFGLRKAPPVGPAAATERARFIAAARRSMEESTAPAVAVPEQDNAEQIDFRSRAERLKAAAAAARIATPSRRRQAYVGIAAALLLAGSFGVVSHVVGQRGAEETTAALPEGDGQRTVTAELGAPQTYRPTVEDKTAAQVVVPEAATEQNLALAEPLDQSGMEEIITGSIPDAPSAAVPELPAEIGAQRLRTAALNGDASAQYEIGARYSEGRNIAADGAKAVEWLTRAADQGMAPAQYRLGSIFEKGTGVARDAKAAERWYAQAAAQGNVKAMHNLGVLYAEGGLGTPDFAAAAEWFEKAAEHGVADSQYNLGVIYTRGLGVTADFPAAYHWFAQAAARGDKDAGEKRDQVGARLDAKALAAAKKRTADWKPQTEIAAANTVPVPAAGWDEPATAQTRDGRASDTTTR